MLKESYITPDNINKKSIDWLNKIKTYSKEIKYNLEDCALLVIDMQKFFLNERSHAFVPAAKTILPNIKKLIAQFKIKNLPVVFTRFSLDENDNGMMSGWWGDKVIEGSDASKIITDLNISKEIVIRKAKYSAFKDTNLKSILGEKDIKNIVITGIMTHLCCDSTARDAFMNDFNVYLVVDATASYNEDLHLSALKTLSHGFAIPVRTGDIIENL